MKDIGILSIIENKHFLDMKVATVFVYAFFFFTCLLGVKVFSNTLKAAKSKLYAIAQLIPVFCILFFEFLWCDV